MADNPIIIYHKKYKESLARFSLDIQQKFMMATWQFVQDPHSSGLYVKPWISGGKASGIMEFRASDYYRCLYRDLGNRTYLFIYACGHNETNQGKKIASKLVTDPDYGNQELIPDDEVIDILIEEIEKSLEPEDEELPKLFDDLSESTLRQLRIPPELYKLVRIIRTREQLKKLEDILPENVYHALDLVSCGESVSDVVTLLFGDEEPEKPSPQNGEINNDPVTASSFISLRTKEEYEQNLTAPLESWRIFLHPEQRRLAEKDFSGPARVTGGAGTGKTVAAMHRAKWLAEHITDGGKVLFTTFTKNLAEDISANLDRLIKNPAVRNRIEVKNLDSWVQNYMLAHSKDLVVYDSQLNKIWEKAYQQNSDASLSQDFYKEEWERVVLRYETFDQEAYRKVPRSGRPLLAGGTDKRNEVWKVFQAYMDQCAKKHQLDQGWAMIRCRKLIQAEGKALYRSIIVDEGQDFSIPAYKLLRAMAGPEHPNDLFITGDSRQRIYQTYQSFSECGINIEGRSARLRMNYRTTEEIRVAAARILAAWEFDDMDGGIDDISGYRSLLTGPAPVIRAFADIEKEADFLREQIEKIIAEDEDLRNICLAVRTNQQIYRYIKLLQVRGIEGVDISKLKDDTEDNRLRIGTMHRIKGLEFNHILIAGADEDDLPPKGRIKPGMDEAKLAEVERSERCLLYVVMTRAKMTVTITSPGPMSRLLDPDTSAKPEYPSETGMPPVSQAPDAESPADDPEPPEMAGTEENDADAEDNTEPPEEDDTDMADIPNPEEETDTLSDILYSAGVEIIDKREYGGALWIIGGTELEPLVQRCQEIGVFFTFKPGGGRVCKGRDAWWTKSPL